VLVFFISVFTHITKAGKPWEVPLLKRFRSLPEQFHQQPPQRFTIRLPFYPSLNRRI
jgi:hypothetical protein